MVSGGLLFFERAKWIGGWGERVSRHGGKGTRLEFVVWISCRKDWPWKRKE
jgi:hypothetical protein